jgi:hypothetical protein
MTTTAISAVVPRKHTALTGRVTSVVAHLRPWVRLNVGLTDGTGAVILRFSGRTQIPGIVKGCRLRVEGTPFKEPAPWSSSPEEPSIRSTRFWLTRGKLARCDDGPYGTISWDKLRQV